MFNEPFCCIFLEYFEGEYFRGKKTKIERVVWQESATIEVLQEKIAKK